MKKHGHVHYRTGWLPVTITVDRRSNSVRLMCETISGRSTIIFSAPRLQEAAAELNKLRNLYTPILSN